MTFEMVLQPQKRCLLESLLPGGWLPDGGNQAVLARLAAEAGCTDQLESLSRSFLRMECVAVILLLA